MAISSTESGKPHVSSTMADADTPRVKLPTPIHRKPVVPGPNSWAQQQQNEQQNIKANEQVGDSRITKRDKYEHKPMPPTPPFEECVHHGPYVLQPKAYIQPAVPFFGHPAKSQTQKARAVTDPVAPKPLFASRKISVKELRRKYSQMKDKGASSKEGLSNGGESSPIVPDSSENAEQVLAPHSLSADGADASTQSAQAIATPDVFNSTHEDSQQPTANPSQQIQSSPVPTRRYLKENGLPSSIPGGSSNASQQQNTEHSERPPVGCEVARERTPANRYLLPPKIITHSNRGEVGLVEASGMHRVESFRGVIEDGPTSNGSNGQAYTESYAEVSQPNTAPTQNSGDLRPHDLYSPSDYGGIWENDPAVGHTLPPFTPMPRGHSTNADIGSRHTPVHANHQDAPDNNLHFNPHYSRHNVPQYQHPMTSAHSWTSNYIRGNSFAPPTAPLSALLPPRWPHEHNTNSVPSPPQSQSDFQRAGSISASLAQIDLTLHHHIESTFGMLSRAITDRDDRVIDQTIRRLDSLEDKLSSGFRDLKNDILDLNRQIRNLQGDVNEIKKQETDSVDLVKGMDDKLQRLEKDLGEHTCKCQQSTPEQSEHESDRRHRSEIATHPVPRRTESAHPTVGQKEPSHPYRSSAGRASNSARVSGASSRRDRSNTINSQQQATSRLSDERSNRREYFAELGAARGPVPDIREHPAFAELPPAQGQGYDYDHNNMPKLLADLPYQNPNLSDGRWYQQAYGQHN